MERQQIQVQVDVLFDMRATIHRDIEFGAMDQRSDSFKELLSLGIVNRDGRFLE